jgi:competence protein ComEC
MPRKKIIMLLAVFLCGFALLYALFSSLPDGKLHIYALDIGQGDAILIRTPLGKNILVDGGPENTVLQKLGEHLTFFDRTIDLAILTHPHSDHIDGLIEILKRYRVKRVVFNPIEYHYPAYEEFLRILENKIPFDFAEASSDYLIEPHVYLDILYPLSSNVGEKFDNINNASVVFALRYGNTRALFMGDAEAEEEREILKSSSDFSAEIMKIGHHGSRTETSEPLFQAVQPTTAIISAGTDNQFQHPHAGTLSLLEKHGTDVFITKDSGTGHWVSNGEHVSGNPKF